MPREYNEDIDKEIIWYEEDGVRVSFAKDESNPDYQAYLNKDNPDWNNQPTL